MPTVPKTVSFTGGKVIETPTSTGVPKEITTLAGTLADQIECVSFSARINPNTNDEEINLGNITTAKFVVLVPTGPLFIKLNGSGNQPLPLAAGPTVWTGTISGIFATNTSTTTAVDLEVYASTDVG